MRATKTSRPRGPDVQPTHTPPRVGISRIDLTAIILAVALLLVCSAITRPAHAVAAVLLAVVLGARLERRG